MGEIIKQKVFTNSPWEPLVGYCRAVRVGNKIEVAGTTAMKDGVVMEIGNPYGQTVYILETIQNILQELGAEMEHVVRTRMFVTDISQWEAIGKAHGEFFKNIQPAATMIEVKALINPDLLVEIEVEAIID